VWAAYSRRVLRHVAGFPDLRLLCPIRHPLGIQPSPACLDAPCSTTPPGRTPCRGSSPVRVPTLTVSSFHFLQEPSGLPEFSNVSLPVCHGLRTPADLHILANSDASVLPSVNVKTLGVRNHLFRSCTSTSGSATSPTAYRILCVRLPRLCSRVTPLRDGINTRYGRVANPYPTGTSTPQETPSFARRDNDQAKRPRAVQSRGLAPGFPAGSA